MNSEESKIMSLVISDPILKSDAVVCLEGDGQKRTKRALEIFEDGLAAVVIVSGGYDNPPFSIIAPLMADYLVQNGIQREKIIIEANSQNTREQAIEAMKIVKKMKWKRIILIASHFHQARAFLTFLKAMEDLKLKIVIINAPAKDSSKPSEKLLDEEFKKIKDYEKKGHVFTFNQALEYQKWKKAQI
jgi:uncharacterized SAM-binding protein YcdF (DUF218 family)